MRTTVDLPDELYRRIKAAAALQGSSVKDTLLRILEREFGGRSKRRRVQLPLIASDRPGTLRLTNEQVNEILSP